MQATCSAGMIATPPAAIMSRIGSMIADSATPGQIALKRIPSSARGAVLEFIKANIEIPPGIFIFEDPPRHTVHRGLVSRVFTPRRMTALEP